jgi:RimJ/RimL family protein N-acetyltransferase
MIVKYQASEYAVYDHQWPTSEEKIQEITEWFVSGDSYLAVRLEDKGTLIGYIALNPEEDSADRAFSFGYVFDFDDHGKGYATEACREVLKYAFQELAADLVVTGTAAANKPSCHLLDRLGFKKVGEGTESFRADDNGNPIEFLGYKYILKKADFNCLDF